MSFSVQVVNSKLTRAPSIISYNYLWDLSMSILIGFFCRYISIWISICRLRVQVLNKLQKKYSSIKVFGFTEGNLRAWNSGFMLRQYLHFFSSRLVSNQKSNAIRETGVSEKPLSTPFSLLPIIHPFLPTLHPIANHITCKDHRRFHDANSHETTLHHLFYSLK